MATSERQKLYNQRYRDKQKKIKNLCRDLDRLVREMESLPRCPACETSQLSCQHTPERRRLNKEAELTHCRLQELDH